MSGVYDVDFISKVTHKCIVLLVAKVILSGF